MRKTQIFSILILWMLFHSACSTQIFNNYQSPQKVPYTQAALTTDTPSEDTKSDDLQYKIVGIWQDIDFPGIRIRFTEIGEFYEYQEGTIVDQGTYTLSGTTITLKYCEGDYLCEFNLRYDPDKNRIIYHNETDFIYTKVK